jgi:hypothetical protein
VTVGQRKAKGRRKEGRVVARYEDGRRKRVKVKACNMKTGR